MKEKILPILKNAVKNSTFSERTFNEVAEAIAKAAITAEIADDKLEAFVTDMLPMFDTFQGDMNNQISRAVKEVKPPKKEEKEESEEEDKPLTAKDLAVIIADANKPLEERLEKYESSSKKSAIIQDVKKQLMSRYNLKEGLCDKVIGRIDITPESTTEDIAKNALAEYNELASSFGLQNIAEGIPSSNNAPAPPAAKDIDDILNKMT